ncbi:MAG: SIR2 family NAD-dependent protein deacylase [Candidatus Aminicenantia bacterium]
MVPKELIDLLKRAKEVSVLTGAGISAESGIPTFRGEDGLWKKYRAEELATPQAFQRDPHLVWEWYNWRREIIAGAKPNSGHIVIAKWESLFPSFWVITQNIDGLHRKAGSRNIVELHGNIWKARCTREMTIEENYDVPLKEIPPKCKNCGALLRPYVVWFGESLYREDIEKAEEISSSSDVIFVLGTSAVVYPAAGLPLLTKRKGGVIVEINIAETPLTSYSDFFFKGKAGEILSQIDSFLNE